MLAVSYFDFFFFCDNLAVLHFDGILVVVWCQLQLLQSVVFCCLLFRLLPVFFFVVSIFDGFVFRRFHLLTVSSFDCFANLTVSCPGSVFVRFSLALIPPP